MEAAGPIFCAGVTVYEPLKKHKVGKGVRVGVVGLGGLGMTAIQLARAVGSDDVYAVSRGSKKEQVAREVGATGFIDSTDANAMSAAAGMLDLVIDTIPSSHDLSPYKKLVKPSTGVVHLLGMHEKFFGTMLAKKTVCGAGKLDISGTGSIASTQEVIDLCDKHKIVPKTQICHVNELNKIMEDLAKGNDTGLRYVLDITTLTDAAFDECTAAPPKIDAHAAEYRMSVCKVCCFCCTTSCCRCCPAAFCG